MLIKYTVEKFMSTLEGVDYTKTFQELKLKYEQDKFEKENKKRLVLASYPVLFPWKQ